MPILVLGFWWGIRRQWFTAKSWVVLFFLQTFIFGGGLAAMNTGEDDEEIVEKVVGESIIEAHEEKAEVFVWSSGILAAVFLMGLWPKMASPSRGLAFLGVCLNLFFAFRVGHSGGSLVYEHNAAAAHSATPSPQPE